MWLYTHNNVEYKILYLNNLKHLYIIAYIIFE